jgi:hypothetical protein
MMKGRRASDLLSSRQSVFYYSDIVGQDDAILCRRPDYMRRHYPSMLIEDVAYHLVPSSSHNTAFRVTFDPADVKVEKLIASALNRYAYNKDLASATHDFFVQCAQTVMGYGEATYELVYLSNPDDGAVVEFQLAYIKPLTVMGRHGQLFQYIPAEVARARKSSQYIPLAPDRIITFSLPASTQKGFGAMMEGLAFLSNHTIPDFVFEVGEDGSRKTSFDSTAHIHLEKRALAEAGKLIGWDARGLFREETLEYYDLHRALIFERFKVELRTILLEKINEALTLAGLKMGYSGQLQMSGLSTLNEVEAAQAHLTGGDRPFQEILKPFRMY